MQFHLGGAHTKSVSFAAALATVLILTTPARAHAQAEVSFGPFIGYATADGGRVASVGIETSVVTGPLGFRLSGFSALDQSPGASSASGEPRLGGDADLMLVFDVTSHGNRESGGSGLGLAPYVFAGAGLTIRDDPVDNGGVTYNSRVTNGWSYGGGLLVPLGRSAQLMGEVRARQAGFFETASINQPTRTEYRVGLSLRLGSLFGRSRRTMPNDASPPRPRRRPSEDPLRVILGGVRDAATVIAPASSSAARVIPTAERYLGTPYRYGGISPVTGFDCSGFVQYVFARNAVKLPRTSRQQAKVGVAMLRSFPSLAAGDLVMFAERGEPISHVAIYAGHNRIIHATSSGGKVRYDDLTTRRGQWFVDHMVAARRVTPDAHGLMLDLVRLLDAKTIADTMLDLGDRAPR